MTDLVQRLRNTAWDSAPYDLRREAADRIEQLERELKDCRNATLEEAAVKCDPEPDLPNEAYLSHNAKAVMRMCAKEIGGMKS